MNWYFADGKNPVGPIDESEFAKLSKEGRIRADTLVWHEGMEKWQPFREAMPKPATDTNANCAGCGKLLPAGELSFIENEQVCADCAPLVHAKKIDGENSAPAAFAEAIIASGRTIGVLSCIGRAWELLTQNFVRIVAVTMLACMILFFLREFSVIGLMVSMLLKAPLFGGIYWFYLKLVRGEPAGVRDAFGGFGASFQQLMLNGIVTLTISFLCLIPFFIANSELQHEAAMEKFSELMQESDKHGFDVEKMSADIQKAAELLREINPAKILRVLLFFFIGLLPVAYLGFIWVFSLQLTIDRRMKFWPAMEVSRRVVSHHAWRMALLLCAAGLIALSGLVIFGVGFFATLPIYIGSVMFAYEDIFGAPHNTPVLSHEDD